MNTCVAWRRVLCCCAVLAAGPMGCASGGTPAAAEGSNAKPGHCDASRVAWAVGQPFNEDTMMRSWHESGAGLIRPIAPEQVVKRDVRDDRLTVYTDDNDVVTRVVCE